jgi:hypothetical protein
VLGPGACNERGVRDAAETCFRCTGRAFMTRDGVAIKDDGEARDAAMTFVAGRRDARPSRRGSARSSCASWRRTPRSNDGGAFKAVRAVRAKDEPRTSSAAALAAFPRVEGIPGPNVRAKLPAEAGTVSPD